MKIVIQWKGIPLWWGGSLLWGIVQGGGEMSKFWAGGGTCPHPPSKENPLLAASAYQSYIEIFEMKTFCWQEFQSLRKKLCLENHTSGEVTENPHNILQKKADLLQGMEDKPRSIQMKIFRNSWVPNRIRLTTFTQLVKSFRDVYTNPWNLTTYLCIMCQNSM